LCRGQSCFWHSGEQYMVYLHLLHALSGFLSSPFSHGVIHRMFAQYALSLPTSALTSGFPPAKRHRCLLRNLQRRHSGSIVGGRLACVYNQRSCGISRGFDRDLQERHRDHGGTRNPDPGTHPFGQEHARNYILRYFEFCSFPNSVSQSKIVVSASA